MIQQLELDPDELKAVLLLQLLSECRRLVNSFAEAKFETLVLNLVSQGPVTSRHIGRALGLTPASVSKALRQLVSEHLCQKKKNSIDFRAPLITITQRGREKLTASQSKLIGSARRYSEIPKNSELVAATDVLGFLFH
jgi:DNA-binding MarR family transcriptional regulator